MTGPLAGFRVIDLCSVVSGPVAAAILADQGAEVIKVETPGGDRMRRSSASEAGLAPMFISCNRGKRSIAIDLKTDDGREVLWRLVDRADVLIQNWRPGVAERLGFGVAAVRSRNPRLVYASISGFGADGPYSGKRTYDPMIQSLSGMADIQADPATGRPRMTRTIVVDKITAVTAAQAVTAALLARERLGEGQHVEVAMLDAMVGFLWPEGFSALTPAGACGPVPLASPHDLIFETRDGWITVGTVSDTEWQGLCQALGHPEWLTDSRFATAALRNENRQARLALVAEVLRDGSRDEWVSLLDAADVPCMPVLKRHEVLDDAQVKARDIVATIDHPDVGAVRQARPAARFDGTPSHSPRPAPTLGADTDAVLAELGYDTITADRLRTSGVVR